MESVNWTDQPAPWEETEEEEEPTDEGEDDE